MSRTHRMNVRVGNISNLLLKVPKMSKQVVDTVVISFDARAYSQKSLRAINKVICGHEDCNEYRDGKIVGKKFDAKTNARLKDAHSRLARSQRQRAEFNVMDDGSLEFVKMI